MCGLAIFIFHCGAGDKHGNRKEKTKSFLTCECGIEKRRRGQRQGGQGKGKIGKSLSGRGDVKGLGLRCFLIFAFLSVSTKYFRNIKYC